jgi:hypothetical protein
MSIVISVRGAYVCVNLVHGPPELVVFAEHPFERVDALLRYALVSGHLGDPESVAHELHPADSVTYLIGRPVHAGLYAADDSLKDVNVSGCIRSHVHNLPAVVEHERAHVGSDKAVAAGSTEDACAGHGPLAQLVIYKHREQAHNRALRAP